MGPPRCTTEHVLAWTALLRAHDVVADHLEAAVHGRVGLTLAEHEILFVVRSRGGQVRMGELASHLVLSKSGVTRLIGKLEQAGLVQRRVPPDNRRTTLAVLTDRGKRTLEQAVPVFEQALAEAFSRHLTDADVAALTRTARKLICAHGGPDPLRATARDTPPPSDGAPGAHTPTP